MLSVYQWDGVLKNEVNEQGMAFVMKLAWGMIEENHLWVKVLKNKYMSSRRREGNPFVISSDLVLWKVICKEWDTVNQNVNWNVKNGRRILFQRENWLERYAPIIDHLEREVHVETLDYTVADMVDSRGNWKWEEFAHLIPVQLVMGLRVMFLLHRIWVQTKWYGINYRAVVS